MGREFKYTFLGFQRPVARVFWAKEMKSKNISGLKSMPYKEPANESSSYQTLNTQTGLNDTKQL